MGNSPAIDELECLAVLKEAPAEMRRRNLIGVDLFAGAGGFSLAAQESGITIVAAVELNKHACTTYRENLLKNNEGILYESNILDLDPCELVEKHFSAGSGCDVLLGGPPCQGFSVHRINNSGVDDPRNSLALRYFEYVKTLRPKVFLMENVPGILWERHAFFLKSIYSMGEGAGYKMYDPVVIDARDYGVPQRRKRVFILGVDTNIDLNLVWPPIQTHGSAAAREINPTLLPWVNADVVFKKEISSGDVNHVHMNHTSALIEVFRNTPLNGGSRRDSGRVLPCHNKHSGHTDVYGRIDPMQPAPTMTTACINPSKGRFVHPTENHGITLRHAARFQTFPDDYVFYGGLMAGGAQVGNAVPVELGKALLKEVTKALLTYMEINVND
jgi:DNA (cytosine-5)-methyltransferase 1